MDQRSAAEERKGICGFAYTGRRQVNFERDRREGLARDLRRMLEGEVLDAPEQLGAYSSDYGQIAHKLPAVVVRPRHAADVQAVVRFAAREGFGVTGRGSGHSLHGQSVSEEAILLDLRSLARIREIQPEELWFDAEAGVLWQELIEATAPRGMVPPVVTGYPHVTLGGTVSTVGWGDSSFRYGAQLDNCLSLEVVTGTGDLIICSPEVHPEVYFHCLGGLGQFGIITALRHRLRRSKPLLRTFLLEYDDLATLLGDAEEIIAMGRADHIEGQISLEEGKSHNRHWRFAIALSIEVDASDALRKDAVLSGLHANRVGTYDRSLVSHLNGTPTMSARPGVSHPWMHTFLPRSQALKHIQFCLDTMPVALLGVKGSGGKVLLSFGLRRTTGMPMLRVPDEESFVLFAISPVIESSMLPVTTAYLSRVSDVGIRLGAKRHLATWVHFDRARWRLHFGDYWEMLNEVKRRCDPFGILGCGVIAFEDSVTLPDVPLTD